MSKINYSTEQRNSLLSFLSENPDKMFSAKQVELALSGKEISKTILEKVKFNDLVFNYKEDGASAIFQNQNTDKSLVIAGDLHTEITSVLSKYNEQRFVGIGISSRTLRLISATRLANESEEALNRADADSPIIAFRVNPERYKDFLASESFQEETASSEQKENESTENKQEE